ncbi:MAG TPA: hypothetical protein DEZ08_07445 [Dehalococcoidia bacterium]|jgi:hypothetical protein|nr:hypothetical protein [Dehalococcoidia bacterium]|tara:strand:- start:1052 stop:1387 length:336 start_codon:yes stop_codon:yes gene_type:complete
MTTKIYQLNRVCFWIAIVAAIVSMVFAAGIPWDSDQNGVYKEFDKVSPDIMYSNAVAGVDQTSNKTYVARGYVLTKFMSGFVEQVNLLWTVTFLLLALILQIASFKMKYTE